MATRYSPAVFSGFRFGADEAAPAGVRRIACEQTDAAVRVTQDLRRSLDERVHEARKYGKKLRAVMRLVRSQNEAFFAGENALVRDAARALATLRDSHVILDACAGLLARCTQPRLRAQLTRLCRKLERERAEQRLDPAIVERKLRDFVRRMQDVRARAWSWPVTRATALHLEHGFVETYRQGRRALRRVQLDPSEENFHELRKRVKEHGFHLRLLRAMWPLAVGERLREVDRLSELLGSERDLAMLGHALIGAAGDLRLTRQVTGVFAFVDQRRVKLRAKALALGRRVLALGPVELLARLRGWRVAA